MSEAKDKSKGLVMVELQHHKKDPDWCRVVVVCPYGHRHVAADHVSEEEARRIGEVLSARFRTKGISWNEETLDAYVKSVATGATQPKAKA